MGRQCSICIHKDLGEINRRLACNEPIAGIARDFAVSEDSLTRHKDKHLPRTLIASPSAAEITEADNLLKQIQDYRREVDELKEAARAEGDIELALKAIDRALKCLDLHARVQGLIQDQKISVSLQQVNIYSSPEWSKVGDVLARVLAPYPELRAEVARELLALARKKP
jgi:hypothetical protein